MAINIPAAAEVAVLVVEEEGPEEALTPIFCSEAE